MCKTCGGKMKRPVEDYTSALPANGSKRTKSTPQISEAQTGFQSARIESIIIHNHGVLNMFPGAGTLPVDAASFAERPAAEKTDHIAAMDVVEQPMEIHAMSWKDDQTGNVAFKNNWPVKLSKVKIRHQYSDWNIEECVWENVEPGSTTDAKFQVKYQTGWGAASTDSWWCEATFAESNVTFRTGKKDCMMRDDDKSSKGSLCFRLEANSFYIDLRSGGCDIEFTDGDFNFNAFAFVRAKNGLPVEAALEVKHKYSDDTGEQASHWQYQSIAPGSYTSYTTVFFMTGPTHWASDHFRVSAWPRYEPPANAPDLANKSLWRDWYQFMLRTEDRGRGVDVIVSPGGMQLRAPSGVSSTTWSGTPAGYNTTCWVQVKNEFVQDIRYLVLKHRYSTDTAYEFDYEDIPARTVSSQKYMMEYFTGGLHAGYDYWDVTVFLKDGSYYTNNTAGKQCFLEHRDAGTLTFSVREDNFHMGLADGCDDGMSNQGKVDYLLGADINRPYAWNCFLASHNAFATEASGSLLINNQSLSLSNQLARGATTLLLDIYWVDNDIWMLHAANEFHGPLINRPWNDLETLKDGLRAVAAFLNRFQDSVVTIVFEDRLDDDNGYQHDVLRQRFQEVGLWDKIFFPSNEMKTDGSKWPSLAALRSQNKPLLCFTSKRNSNLPYQWDYMTETVYGNESLNLNTWTQKRGESSDLGTLATFAMNHFPTIQIGGLLNKAQENNKEALLKAHVDACISSPGGIPNWLNMDYIEIGWCALATAYCNDKFKEKHSVRAAAFNLADAKAATPSIELVESRFIRLAEEEQANDAETANGHHNVDECT